ncbi:hypothetical protein HAX54_013734, partial [Datura stramonium]|nr:hypothetical protein [Datura stramonium]
MSVNCIKVAHRRTAGCASGIAGYFVDSLSQYFMLASIYRAPVLRGSRPAFCQWGADKYDVYPQ